MTTESTPPAETPPRRRRPRTRWITLALFLAAAIWLGRFVYTRLTGEPTPRPEYWTQKIMALDPPPPGAITEHEFGNSLERFYTLKDDFLQNSSRKANLRAVEIRAGYGSLQFLNMVNDPNRPGHRIWNHQVEIPSTFTERFEDPGFETVRMELLEALRKGWTIDPQLQSLGYYFFGYLEWATILALHGRWAYQENQNTQLLLEDWKMMLLLARQIQRPRMPHHLDQAFAIQTLTSSRMMAFVDPNFPPIDSLLLAEEIDEITGPRMSFEELLEGQRLWDQYRLENVYVRDGGWLSPKAYVELSRWRWGGGAVGASRWWNLASPVFYDLETAREQHEVYYQKLAARATSLAAAFHQSRLRYPDPEGVLPSPILTGNERFYYDRPEATAYAHQLISRCMLDAGLTMLALHEYHRRHEVYPDSLEDLVPDFLPRLPIDDAHEARQPLRYRRRRTVDGQDYVLYSVGINGVDDGGRHIEGRVPAFEEGQSDVVFTAIDWRETPR